MRERICNGGDVAHCRLAEALKAVGTSKAPDSARIIERQIFN
jgi:hypothetical protein